MPTLTTEQNKKVEAGKRKERPQAFDPSGAGAKTIGEEFEQWLILTPKTSKAKIIDWVNNLMKEDPDDAYQDLLKETMDKESAGLELEDMDRASSVDSYKTWKKDNLSLKGFKNVKEIGWLFQELQQGQTPFTFVDDVFYRSQMNRATGERFRLSKDSLADRKTRLRSWVVLLNSY